MTRDRGHPARPVLSMRIMRTAIAFVSLLLVSCGGTSDGGEDCVGGKCDVPHGSTEQKCASARVPAMDQARPHFTPAGVRWSCADVNNVTPNSDTSDDRGQEYCEYFSMLHTKGIPEMLLDNAGQPIACDESTPCATGSCDMSTFSCVSGTKVDLSQPAAVLGKNVAGKQVSPLDPKLTAGQVEWLSNNGDQKVGECVFTSWHADIDREPMVTKSTPLVGGHRITETSPGGSSPLFQMNIGINSNSAARTLIKDCLREGDASIEDGFTRGCMMCGNVPCEPYRKSDPSVCTLSMKIAECGCKINVKESTGGEFRPLDMTKSGDAAIAMDLFVPNGRRGFTLGTWDGIGKLPQGCQYVRMGDPWSIMVGGIPFNDPNADQTLVVCELKASHLTTTMKDPKEACRKVYGEEVVIHVRAPDPSIATITCDTSRKCDLPPWNFPNL